MSQKQELQPQREGSEGGRDVGENKPESVRSGRKVLHVADLQFANLGGSAVSGQVRAT